MSEITINEYAKELGWTTSAILKELNDLGLIFNTDDQLISDAKRWTLFENLKSKGYVYNSNQLISVKTVTEESIKQQIEIIINADNLRAIDLLLTFSMTHKKIQSLIKDENLAVIAGAIIDLVLMTEQDHLLATAMLGRLGAVSRSREEQVYIRLEEILEEKPETLESLLDGDEKSYAARAIIHINKPWLNEYCIEQVASLETAENARKICLNYIFSHYKNLSNIWDDSSEFLKSLHHVDNIDARFKKVRRITAVWLELVKEWDGDVGDTPGEALALWLSVLIRGDKKQLEDEQILFDILDNILSMLLRVIELRFSFALTANTYEVIEKIRSGIGGRLWDSFIQYSNKIDSVRMCLKETALVLARQNRTDKDVMNVFRIVYDSEQRIASSLKSHFEIALELDLDIRQWWIKAGNVKESSRAIKHKMGNSEDQQIGSLLIEVETSKEVMEKLERAVVPMLELSDPPLASCVKKATSGYSDMARIARQLARMRKLTHTDLKGEILEYNPLEHELLGGHKRGIRYVKVLREGIKKEFASKVKLLVKPWVEPLES